MASKVIRNITKVFRSASGVLFGRKTAGTGRGEELTPGDVRTLLSVYTISQTDTAISTAVNTLIGGAPGLLDTLDELSAALGDDANFAATMTTALAGKVDSSSLSESIDDRVASLLVAGTNITLTYNDASGTLTVASTSSGTNTGDQNLFSTIAVSGQSSVVADATSDTLTLVAGTNITITTDASTDTITITASGGSGVGGSTGATDNRVLRSDGTGGATVQNSAVTIDDSGNVTGIVSEVISRGTNAGNAALTIGGSGGGTTRVNDNGTVVINGDVSTGTYPLKVQYNGSDRVIFGYSGNVDIAVVGQPLSIGGGVLHVVTASGSRALVKSYVNLELSPGSLGGGGTYVEINSGTAGTYRDLKLRDMTASGMICAGTYTVGTLPSAAANAYKFATVSDSSVTTFGSTVAGGGSSKVQVYSNGSNWTVCAA